MKKSLCIVVANSSMARCFERTSAAEPLVPGECLVHPESRLHARDLETDRPGHTHKDDAGRTSLAPRTEIKERERTEFAREVARFLQQGAGVNRYNGIVLFASNPFLGELLSQLDQGVRQLVTATHALDLTSFEPKELEQRVRSALQP